MLRNSNEFPLYAALTHTCEKDHLPLSMYRLSALLLLLTLPVAAAEPLRKLSLGVRIDGGSQALPLAPPVSQFLAAPLPIAVAAGRLLLHRRGAQIATIWMCPPTLILGVPTSI
jgi:hypothetical protein